MPRRANFGSSKPIFNYYHKKQHSTGIKGNQLLIRQLYTTMIRVSKKRTHKCLVSSCPLQSVLDQTTEDGSKTKSGHVGHVHDGGAVAAGGGRAAAAAGGGRGARGSIAGGGVGGAGLAGVGTTDDVVLAQGLEGAAAEVTSALHVEATLDLGQGREGNPGHTS